MLKSGTRAIIASALAAAAFLAAGWFQPRLAEAADIGYRDFSYGTSGNSTPTGEKPQNKLWWNDGYWWGSLYNNTLQEYHIYRLNPATQTWIDTGTPIDDRNTTKSDTLWDGTYLYVVSNLFANTGSATTSSANWGRLYRYTYNAATDTYTLSSGFPVTVTKGKGESLTLAKDSTGRLWVTYVESTKVMVNHSTTSDSTWANPFTLSATSATGLYSDDISAVVAFGGNKIGVMWSNQIKEKMYFAVHQDGDPTNTWQPEEIALQASGTSDSGYADDHINLKADGSGTVYAATKTSTVNSASPILMLLKRTPAGAWSYTVHSLNSDGLTRPIVLLDEPNNRLYFFASIESGGSVYYKSSPMSNPSFSGGRGTVFLENSSDPDINNGTSTRQNLNNTTGLTVMASDKTSRYYLHNNLNLDLGATPTPTNTPTNTPTATPTWTPTAGPSPTPSNTPLPTDTPTITPTPTDTPLATATPTGVPVKRMTFEDGSLTHPTSGADSTSGTVVLDSTGLLKGIYSADIPSMGSSYLQENFSGVNDLYVSLYVKFNTMPSGDLGFVQIANTGTTVGSIKIHPTGGGNGTLQLFNGSAKVGADSAPLTAGTLYRVGIRQKAGVGGTSILEAYLAVGDAGFGAPFAMLTNGAWTTAPTRLRVGSPNSTILDVTFDDILLDSMSMPGPSAPAATPTPTATATPSHTPTATFTPSATATPSNTPPPSNTPTDTATPTETATPSQTPTPSNTPLATDTPTATPTPADTLTPTPTDTPTVTATPTDTPEPTATPAGAPIKDITFEDGSLTHPVSGADSAGSTIVLNAAGLIKGQYSADFPTVSSGYLQEKFAATDDLYLSFYLVVNSLPSADLRVALISNNGTTVGALLLRSNGALRLRDGGTTIGAESAPLAVGTVYRIGLHQKRGTGGNAVLEAFVAAGDAPFGAPFAATTAGAWTTAADMIRLGVTATGTLDATLDDIRLDAVAMPGPSVP